MGSAVPRSDLKEAAEAVERRLRLGEPLWSFTDVDIQTLLEWRKVVLAETRLPKESTE